MLHKTRLIHIYSSTDCSGTAPGIKIQDKKTFLGQLCCHRLYSIQILDLISQFPASLASYHVALLCFLPRLFSKIANHSRCSETMGASPFDEYALLGLQFAQLPGFFSLQQQPVFLPISASPLQSSSPYLLGLGLSFGRLVPENVPFTMITCSKKHIKRALRIENSTGALLSFSI